MPYLPISVAKAEISIWNMAKSVNLYDNAERDLKVNRKRYIITAKWIRTITDSRFAFILISLKCKEVWLWRTNSRF